MGDLASSEESSSICSTASLSQREPDVDKGTGLLDSNDLDEMAGEAIGLKAGEIDCEISSPGYGANQDGDSALVRTRVLVAPVHEVSVPSEAEYPCS
jgi:hypothetical protein